MTMRCMSDNWKMNVKLLWDYYEMAVKWLQELFKVWKVSEIILVELKNIGCLENKNCDIAERYIWN